MFGDTLESYDQVHSEVHLEAVIEPVWRFTLRTRYTQRCTFRSGLSWFGDALGGHDPMELEEYFKEITPEEVDWRAVDWAVRCVLRLIDE